MNLPIEIVTLVLDGMPWIAHHYRELERLTVSWRWHVVEGVAANLKCTSWCESMIPRLSTDGTTEYLDALAAYDTRVILYRKEQWAGKVVMMNEPLRYIHWPCLLLQMDSDELWTADQIEKLHALFRSNPRKTSAMFYCDYRVGPKLRITSMNAFGNNTEYEWRRAWRRMPGQLFKTHEPPVLEGDNGETLSHAETRDAGLVFRHEAYSTEAQVAWKQKYYGSKNNELGHLYAKAVNGWRKLQKVTKFPVEQLSEYLPFVGKNVVVERI